MAKVEIDKDLARSLTVAKKKARNFALVVKGTNVLKLLIEKKPIKDSDLQRAKKESQGNGVIRGVVKPGDGSELVFQVLEEPSVGTTKLRVFITETTGLALKPIFAVVPALTEIDDDLPDDEPSSSQPGDKSQERSPQVAPDNPSQSPSTLPSLSQWHAVRTDVLGRLKAIATEIAAERHAESAKAIVELKAVIANLTENPTTTRQIDELQRYLQEDAVVADVCELANDIRGPLLEALRTLQKELSA